MKNLKITLESGLELTLYPLTMKDIQDGEDELKMGPMVKWMNHENMKISNYGKVIWLLARKTGKTQEQQLKGDWALSLDQVMVNLTITDVNKYAQRISKVFFESGSGVGQNLSTSDSE